MIEYQSSIRSGRRYQQNLTETSTQRLNLKKRSSANWSNSLDGSRERWFTALFSSWKIDKGEREMPVREISFSDLKSADLIVDNCRTAPRSRKVRKSFRVRSPASRRSAPILPTPLRSSYEAQTENDFAIVFIGSKSLSLSSGSSMKPYFR